MAANTTEQTVQTAPARENPYAREYASFLKNTEGHTLEVHEGREVEVGIWPAHPELDGNDPEAIVVQINTGERTGRIRVNLNEAPVWDGDPSTDEQPSSLFHTNPEVQHLLREKEQQS